MSGYRDPYATSRYGAPSSRPQGPPSYHTHDDRDDRSYTSSHQQYQQQGGGQEVQEVQEEDEDVEAIKQEMRFTKQESLASTRNAIRIAAEAEEQGRDTLAKLGTQSERLASVEKNLDMASTQNRIAEDRAAELRRLNRSIFSPNWSNPFNKASRAEEEERRIQIRHERERQDREESRKFAYDSQQRVNSALTGKSAIREEERRKKASLLDRSRYQFEADEEDNELEKDIDANLDTLGDVASRLKGLAMATNSEIGSQNEKLNTITDKVSAFLFFGFYTATNDLRGIIWTHVCT